MILTVAGHNGSGKTTTAKALARRLKMDYFYMGMEFRKKAQDHNMTIEEFDTYVKNHPEIDREMDAQVYPKLAKQENVVVDSRAGWHFLPESVKIFLTAPLGVRATRVAAKPRRSEEHVSVEQAMQNLQSREDDVRSRLKAIYDIDVYNPDNFDIVIDTDNMSIEATVDKILEECKRKGIQL